MLELPEALSAFQTLKARSSIAWIRERDVDLLLCSELYGNAKLQVWLADKLGFGSQPFQGAWVSHAEQEGESDLVVAFGVEKCRTLALIENKIDASFQKDQGLRYAQRAQRWAKEGDISRVITALLAPAKYHASAGDHKFDARLDYEEVVQALKQSSDRRSAFLAQTLDAGIEAARRGYVMNPNANVTDMWSACWRICVRVAPKLNFVVPGPKPGRSTWFYFRNAEGFDSVAWRQAVVVFKAERGQVDLQFGNMTTTRLAQLTEGLRVGDMKVVSAAKSSSIRVGVPIVDFFGAEEAQEKSIAEGFVACERLRQFFVENRDRLLPTGRCDR